MTNTTEPPEEEREPTCEEQDLFYLLNNTFKNGDPIDLETKKIALDNRLKEAFEAGRKGNWWSFLDGKEYKEIVAWNFKDYADYKKQKEGGE